MKPCAPSRSTLSTRSRYRMLPATPVLLSIPCQNASSSSLEVWRKLTLPTNGISAGCVITSLARGYWKTQPPRLSCSIVTNCIACDFAARLAANPAGPAPTITRSSCPGLAARRLRWIASTACLPCASALRMSPIPPSSPAMKSPGTVDSNSALSNGISTPRRSVPKTSVIASAGHAARHAPCPMQSVGLTRCALPSDQAEYVMFRLFWTRSNAGSAPDAANGIDDGMQGSWIDQPGGLRLFARRPRLACSCRRRRRRYQRPDRYQRQQVDGEQ